MIPKNLYLERLRRMSDQELLDECQAHGKRMESLSMNKEEKIRAFLCFKYTTGKPNIDNEDKQMLVTAMKVLRLL